MHHIIIIKLMEEEIVGKSRPFLYSLHQVYFMKLAIQRTLLQTFEYNMYYNKATMHTKSVGANEEFCLKFIVVR